MQEASAVRVAWAHVESPLGRLLVAVTPAGLVRIELPPGDEARFVADLARAFGSAPVESSRRLAPVRRELDEYFAGRRRRFELPLDRSLAGGPRREGATEAGFRARVLDAMIRIPYGTTTTYTELAETAGNRRAARAAGHTCATNPIPIVIPCHRVLRRDGGLGGFPGGVEQKERLLRLELCRESLPA